MELKVEKGRKRGQEGLTDWEKVEGSRVCMRCKSKCPVGTGLMEQVREEMGATVEYWRDKC